MSVDLRRSYRTVTEYLLYIAYINVLLKKQSSERMPEHMRGDMAFVAHGCGVPVYHSPNRLLGQAVTELIDKEIA